MEILSESGDPEGHEVPTGPRDLDGPQSVLSCASQGFNFHVGELDVIEMELDTFYQTLLSSESEPEGFDFRRGFSFDRDGWRWERDELKNKAGWLDDLPFSVAVATNLFVLDIRLRLRLLKV